MSNLRFIADRGVILPDYFKWNDAISVFCKHGYYAFLADRFGYLNNFSPIRAAEISKYKFPTGSYSKSFYDVMMDRASYIKNICDRNNIHCYIMWSGGCDSTGVVSAMLESGLKAEYIHILYTISSINEYKDFYEYMKARGVQFEQVSYANLFDVAYFYAEKGHIVLTGFPADQLFGSVIGQTYQKDTTKIHWTEFLNEDVANQQYECAFKYYNIPISTVAEFLWFNNFVLKWDYVCYPSLMMINKHNNNIIPFYNDISFEEWSVANFDVLHKYDQKNTSMYKLELKNFIYKITNLKSIFFLKKIPSLARAYEMEPNNTLNKVRISGIDDDSNIITSERNIGNDNELIVSGLCASSIMRRFLKR
jgi:hypothetical protein